MTNRHQTFTTCLVGLLLLGGCDLLGEDNTAIEASGLVVLAETKEPIAGLNVVLIEDASGFGGSRVLTTTQTDNDGRFTLLYENGIERFGYDVYINDSPSDPRYTGRSFVVEPGEPRDLGVIELEENEAP